MTDRADRRSAMEIAPLAFICLGGAYLRLRILDRPIEYDEAFTYLRYAATPFWHAVHTYDLPNNHIFHTVLAWMSTRVFEAGAVSLRLPVFVSGLLIPPLCYLLGERVSGRTTGLIAAALAAGNTLLVDYSANARGYGLQTMLLLVALLAVPRLVRRPTRTNVVALALPLSLGLATVPTLILGIGVVFAWGAALAVEKDGPGLSSPSIRGLFESVLVTAILTIIFFAPALHFVLTQTTSFKGGGESFGWFLYLEKLASYFGHSQPSGTSLFMWAAIAVGLGIELRKRFFGSVALVWTVPTLVLVLLYFTVADRSLFTRSMFFALPLLMILAGHGVSRLVSSLGPAWDRQAKVAVSCLAVGLFVISACDNTKREDVRQDLAKLDSRLQYRVLRDHLQPGDWLATNDAAIERLRFYFATEEARQLLPVGPGSWEFSVVRLVDTDGGANDAVARGPRNVLFLQFKEAEKQAAVEWFRRNMQQTEIGLDRVWASEPTTAGDDLTLWRVHPKSSND